MENFSSFATIFLEPFDNVKTDDMIKSKANRNLNANFEHKSSFENSCNKLSNHKFHSLQLKKISNFCAASSEELNMPNHIYKKKKVSPSHNLECPKNKKMKSDFEFFDANGDSNKEPSSENNFTLLNTEPKTLNPINANKPVKSIQNNPYCIADKSVKDISFEKKLSVNIFENSPKDSELKNFSIISAKYEELNSIDNVTEETWLECNMDNAVDYSQSVENVTNEISSQKNYSQGENLCDEESLDSEIERCFKILAETSVYFDKRNSEDNQYDCINLLEDDSKCKENLITSSNFKNSNNENNNYNIVCKRNLNSLPAKSDINDEINGNRTEINEDDLFSDSDYTIPTDEENVILSLDEKEIKDFEINELNNLSSFTCSQEINCTPINNCKEHFSFKNTLNSQNFVEDVTELLRNTNEVHLIGKIDNIDKKIEKLDSDKRDSVKVNDCTVQELLKFLDTVKNLEKIEKEKEVCSNPKENEIQKETNEDINIKHVQPIDLNATKTKIHRSQESLNINDRLELEIALNTEDKSKDLQNRSKNKFESSYDIKLAQKCDSKINTNSSNNFKKVTDPNITEKEISFSKENNNLSINKFFECSILEQTEKKDFVNIGSGLVSKLCPSDPTAEVTFAALSQCCKTEKDESFSLKTKNFDIYPKINLPVQISTLNDDLSKKLNQEVLINTEYNNNNSVLIPAKKENFRQTDKEEINLSDKVNEKEMLPMKTIKSSEIISFRNHLASLLENDPLKKEESQIVKNDKQNLKQDKKTEHKLASYKTTSLKNHLEIIANNNMLNRENYTIFDQNLKQDTIAKFSTKGKKMFKQTFVEIKCETNQNSTANSNDSHSHETSESNEIFLVKDQQTVIDKKEFSMDGNNSSRSELDMKTETKIKIECVINNETNSVKASDQCKISSQSLKDKKTEKNKSNKITNEETSSESNLKISTVLPGNNQPERIFKLSITSLNSGTDEDVSNRLIRNSNERNNLKSDSSIDSNRSSYGSQDRVKDEKPKESNIVKDYLEDEKDDIINPKWEAVKNLSTNEERYQQVRQCWQSRSIPDPNKNLSYHSYRKRLFRSENSETRIIRQHKRQASSNLSGREAKRLCTFFLDKEIDTITKTKNKKKQEIINEMHVQISSIDKQYYQEERQLLKNCYGYNRKAELYNQYSYRVSVIANDYNNQADSLDDSFLSQIGTLNERRDEVLKFYRFYKGLTDTNDDPTILTETQFQELEEIENMYEQFDYYYGNQKE